MERATRVAIVFLIGLALMGCISPEDKVFSISLLEDAVPAVDLSAVDLGALHLQQSPILSSADIISYTENTHEIELTTEAFARIQQLFSTPVRVSGMPFVVCVGADRIYAGAFWTPASSISFDGVVICQPLDPDRHIIRIALGYPSPQAFTGQDPRSDQRILRSLDAAGKLQQ